MAISNLITRVGWETLDKRLKYLWKEERPRVTKVVSWAASLGDRSENADYKENKHLLRSIDREIRFLVKRLEVLEIVDYHPQQDGAVYFGAYVELEDDDGCVIQCRIVGRDELDPLRNFVTVDSPMAKALIGKQVDDEAKVNTPSGKKTWYINKIQYSPFTE
ncbi:transcription elongation factor GreB [Moritella sp. Urea-trap-13]|uniref:transcription elongation factor GreB n=1 Tax=Moritella sp. Urea-trap-13 TaxID=2058327 RepID=UPI000C344B82|nr:transcription elongation factor GreB [Moritella sp. Urea-trap-13]PKH09097.1 transcription elongation factor GreB [Moritella sp. Urea-trap-13]